MVIIGIDPGTRTTGFGIIKSEGSSLACIEYGAIANPQRLTPWECHARIFEGIEKLVREHRIDAAAVESQFFAKNARTSLKIGEARSAALIPITRARIPITEYAPKRVKQAVVGFGGAQKDQVQHMVHTLLNLRAEIKPEDASDALAIAICHAHHRTSLKLKASLT